MLPVLSHLLGFGLAVSFLKSCLSADVFDVLSRDWTNGTLYSPTAKMLRDYESKCNDEVYYHGLRNEGMGSDFHVWSQALCNSMQYGVSMNIASFTWIWNDPAFCGNSTQTTPFGCYFDKPNSCPPAKDPPFIPFNNRMSNCQKYIHNEKTRADFRAGALEHLFSHVSRRIVNETEHVARDLFNLTRGGSIPKDMITVHVRWGDKAKEMSLVTAERFVETIVELVKKHNIAKPVVYLVTESSDAVQQVTALLQQSSVPNAVVLSHGVHLFDAHRNQMSSDTRGHIGRANMVSLLLALEAKYFVLTTASNWSRVINELRLNVLEHQHGEGYTTLVDLEPNGHYSNW